MSEPSVIPLFSTPLYVSDEKYVISDSLLNFFLGQETNELKVDNGSGGNYVSKDSYILNNKQLNGLKEFLEKQLYFYVRNVLSINKKTDFYITQSWCNINKKESWHHIHRHQNSMVSGVFYVSGDNCPIVFKHGNYGIFGPSFEFEVDEFNLFNSGRWSMENKNYRVFLFPSILEHYVEVNESEKPRVSLSFNTFFRGSAGKKDGLNELVLN